MLAMDVLSILDFSPSGKNRTSDLSAGLIKSLLATSVKMLFQWIQKYISDSFLELE